MARMLVSAGYTIVPKDQPADINLINTCTVTARADFEARQLIRRAYRLNPDSRTIVAGCLAQVQPEALAALPGVALILGQGKAELLDRLQADISRAMTIHCVHPTWPLSALGLPVFDRTRAFFRIQDGCSAHCTYCIVPRARGASRSLPPADVIAGVEYYAAQGYAEVVLTGIHLGAWGADLNPPVKLVDLLANLLHGDGPRLRLSSLEPNEVTDRMIDLLKNSPRFCPHWHLPLQSGSDSILAAMGRPYTAADYGYLVEQLAGYGRHWCLGADVLVGFPGEGPEEFQETYDLLARLPIAYLHVFPFSRRSGTPAADWPNQVPDREKKKRVAALRHLSVQKRQAFYRRCLGQVRSTLIENTRDPRTGLARGLTDNYLSLLLPEPAPAGGSIVLVGIDRLEPDGHLWGRLLQ